MPDTPGSPFGRRLREWRRFRGLSQLALATGAATTSRHVSFLETGRSRPSLELVLRLCEVIDVPLRQRNELLEAAGLAPAYPHLPLDSEGLTPYLSGVESLLDAHDPMPGLVFDAKWRVLIANVGARRLFGDGVVGSNMVDRMMSDGPQVLNWEETN